MLDHYLAVGGNEIVNSQRAYAYAMSVNCPATWLTDPECGTIGASVGDADYSYTAISDAPWFDPDDPDTTGRFLGLYGVSIRGLSDSTREAAVTQLNTEGATVSGYRHGPRDVRVRAWMTAQGGDALEAGMTWLRNVLEPNACGQHGGTCGEADSAFFVDCPPERVDGQTEADWNALVDTHRRYLHSVRCISGPFEVEYRESRDGIHVGRLVEFTLLAQVPWVYGLPREVDVPPLVPTVMQDIAYNLAPFPSAEKPGAATVVSTNYATNPSLETDDSGWRGNVGAPISLSNIIASRVVGELAAVGTASWRVVFTAPGAGSGGYFCSRQVTGFSPIPATAGTRVSISMWSSVVVISGSPVVTEIRFTAFWYNGTTELGTTDLGALPLSGGPISAKGLVPAVGATSVVVEAKAVMGAYNSGDVVRLYSDALAVTVP